MIFDYILNNRFYTQNDDAASPQEEKTPVADIIPTAPHNRLETFLNMIVGKFKGMAAADPIKPISEMEYWLNEIAAAKGGNPWKDSAGGIKAKLVTVQRAETDRIFPMYMLDLDLGIAELPYPLNDVWFTVEGDHYFIKFIKAAGSLNDEPMSQIAENTYEVVDPFFTLLPADSEKSTELSNMPGIFVVMINACLYQLAGENIHAQMLFALMEGDGDFDGDPNHLYTNADSVIINTSFDHVEEGKKS